MPTRKPTRPPAAIVTLAALLDATAEPTRAQLLMILGDGERHVGALADELGHRLQALNRHLTLLRHAGLVEFREDGPRHTYFLTEAGRAMRDAVEALGR